VNAPETVSFDALRHAAASGIITHAQLDALLQGASAPAMAPNEAALLGYEGDEQLSFVRSFGDIFIAIGVALALGALGIGLGEWNIAVGCGVTLFIGAGLGEWLVRKRRLALPGMVLALGMTIAGGVFLPALFGYGNKGASDMPTVLLAGLGAFAVAAAFYWRHKLPFALTLIGGALAMTLIWASGAKLESIGVLILLAGLIAFAAAMWFDKQDRARIGRLADCGFWLHILAAPLLTHGFVSLLGFSMAMRDSVSDLMPSLLLLAFFGAMCAVALFIDRRALLVSAFTYVIGAMIQLVNIAGGSGAHGALIVAGVFGLFVILLGVYWHALRTKLFSGFSNGVLASWVPPFRAVA
jgi:hypothetical protein